MCNANDAVGPGVLINSLFKKESTNKGGNQRSKYVTQVQQQRSKSPTVTLTWHACKYKVHKLHQRYILNNNNNKKEEEKKKVTKERKKHTAPEVHPQQTKNKTKKTKKEEEKVNKERKKHTAPPPPPSHPYLNQPTRELINARKTSHKHNDKDPSRLLQVASVLRVNRGRGRGKLTRRLTHVLGLM